MDSGIKLKGKPKQIHEMLDFSAISSSFRFLSRLHTNIHLFFVFLRFQILRSHVMVRVGGKYCSSINVMDSNLIRIEKII